MFYNLGRDPKLSASFTQHNFLPFLSSRDEVPDPASDVEEALRDHRGYIPPHLIATLQFTLSGECCRAFREKYREELITERDYYLSKLYQFFSVSLMDEGCQPAFFREAARRLEEVLDSLFPDRTVVPDLTGLNWATIFADYKRRGLEAVIADLPSYLPSLVRGGDLTAQEVSAATPVISAAIGAEKANNGQIRGRRGPAPAMEHHRKVAEVVRLCRESNWKKEIYDIARELDDRGVSAPEAWRKWKPQARRWVRATEKHSERVIKVIEYSLKMLDKYDRPS